MQASNFAAEWLAVIRITKVPGWNLSSERLSWTRVFVIFLSHSKQSRSRWLSSCVIWVNPSNYTGGPQHVWLAYETYVSTTFQPATRRRRRGQLRAREDDARRDYACQGGNFVACSGTVNSRLCLNMQQRTRHALGPGHAVFPKENATRRETTTPVLCVLGILPRRNTCCCLKTEYLWFFI